MNNHVILCGLGELGFRTLERLRALGDEVVVLDPDPQPRFRQQLAEWNVPLFCDEARTPRALRDAGVLTARAVIATTNDDVINLGIALAAREENHDVALVVRLFNPRLAEKVEAEVPRCRVLDVAALAAPVFTYAGLHDDILHCVDVPGGRFLLRRWLGAAPVDAMVLAVKRQRSDVFEAVSPGGIGFSLTAQPGWDTLPLDDHAVHRGDVAFGLTRVDDEGGRDAGSRSDGASQRFRRVCRAARRHVATLAQNRLSPVLLILLLLTLISMEIFHQRLHLGWLQSLYFVVTVMTTTGFGDISVKDAAPVLVSYVIGLMAAGSLLMATLYAFITEALLSIRLGQLFDRRTTPQRDHFIICGLGTVGFRIAEELVRLGLPAVAVERHENSRLVERARRLGVNVVVSPDIFGALGDLCIDEARCVLTVTDDDALNLELALLAQGRNPEGRVVVRLFDPHMAGLFARNFGIQLARSPSEIAAPAFAVAASGEDLYDAFDLGDLLWCVGAVTITPDHPLVGERASALPGLEIQPLTWRHETGVWESRVPPDAILVAGDELVVVTPHDRWLRLQRG